MNPSDIKAQLSIIRDNDYTPTGIKDKLNAIIADMEAEPPKPAGLCDTCGDLDCRSRPCSAWKPQPKKTT